MRRILDVPLNRHREIMDGMRHTLGKLKTAAEKANAPDQTPEVRDRPGHLTPEAEAVLKGCRRRAGGDSGSVGTSKIHRRKGPTRMLPATRATDSTSAPTPTECPRGWILGTVVAMALSPVALAAPAHASPPLTRMCNSDLLVEAGSSGSGGSFEVSSRPRDAARDLDPDGGTDQVWNDMWNCVNGGFAGAAVTAAQGESLYQQLWCHMRYDFGGAFGGPTWDLEAKRPPIPWDQIRNPMSAAGHKCNW